MAKGQRDRTCRGRSGGRAGAEVVATEGGRMLSLPSREGQWGLTIRVHWTTAT